MKSEMIKALVAQYTEELSSAHKYVGMENFFHSKSLNGFAHWMRLQADEERAHAEKIAHYLLDRGACPAPGELQAAPVEYSSALHAFEESLKQEIDLQQRFETLSELAKQHSDNTTLTFLEWFLSEQVEEIASCHLVIDKLKLIGSDGSGLLVLDAELGKRSAEG